MQSKQDIGLARRGAFSVAAIYAAFATLWILLSDQMLLWFIDDPAMLLRASVAKGWFFVLVTALLLYFLVGRLVAALAEAYQREAEMQAESLRTFRLLETIWNNASEAVFAKDLEGRYTLANRKVAEYAGLADADLVGKDDAQLFSVAEARRIREPELAILASGQTQVAEEQMATAIGLRRFVTTKGPLLDEANRIVGTFGIAHDITELKSTEAALRDAAAKLDGQRRLQKLFIDHAPAALAMLDRELNHMFASRRWLEDFGVSDADMRGPNHYDVFPEIPEHWRAMHQRGLAGESFRSDGEYLRRASGEALWVRWELLPWRDEAGEIGGIVIFSEDITAEYQAREEVRQLNAQLEQRVVERTAELNAANRELDAFAYAVSHDLRAPLRAMDGFASALQEDHGDRLEGEARLYLDQIIIASRKMGELIDGILTLSRSTRGELSREVVDISAMVAARIAELQREQPAHRVELDLQPGLSVRGDPRMVEALLTNLVDNAWKYSAKASVPKIRVLAAELGGRPGIRIEDNGAGFDMAYAERLFQPFQRLHRQDEFPGIGIGLATVQRIVRRHGGDIRATGQPGQGAAFTFTLELVDDRSQAADNAS